MRIKTLKRGVAAVALGMMAGAAAAQEVNLRMISGWDDRFDGTVAIATAFGACVAEQSAGRIAVTQSGPEVIPPNQQFDPVSRGLFDHDDIRDATDNKQISRKSAGERENGTCALVCCGGQ